MGVEQEKGREQRSPVSRKRGLCTGRDTRVIMGGRRADYGKQSDDDKIFYRMDLSVLWVSRLQGVFEGSEPGVGGHPRRSRR